VRLLCAARRENKNSILLRLFFTSALFELVSQPLQPDKSSVLLPSKKCNWAIDRSCGGWYESKIGISNLHEVFRQEY
jgi:hypothetical protein